ncbi:uncharacterized protein MELLADRAFT_109413 [Melampsora larici-populina 98AG31]|uniref:Uncharacterized protein n=1 Tax=Melampsora larici-populina (strain 98AG31 / pathotype 3-4-7) TaxID=747676 RepID=F4RWE0_MELLP|nr:uncharacterized protein MELLADRAFT_109413 [Melampsora larici-populina 98AG31]EGG03338.1 hypothetical protein MELLADRAFT_109413 [Melampsora larici-populina 98AG31]
MASQDQSSTQMFNKDVEDILSKHKQGREKTDQEIGGANRGRGKGKATRGRGRGRRRGRGGTATTRKTRSKTKGKIQEPKDESSGEERNLTEEKEESGKEEGRGEKDVPGGDEEEEDTVLLVDEAEFSAEDAHIDREHERYISELTKHYKRGNTGRFEILERAYARWCERIGTDQRGVQMLDASSEEVEVEVSETKRKAKEKVSNKPAKVGKKMNPGEVLTHRLINLAPYWDNRMKLAFGYVLLTIFVPAWLLADKNHMSNRRKQSSLCSDVVALKYGREDIASRLEEHYKIVLAIKDKYHKAFAPALRYNITHRTNVFSHTLEDGELSDVGIKNEEIAEQAIADSKANGDHWYFDNPYIVGGAMENTNPATGRMQVGYHQSDFTEASGSSGHGNRGRGCRGRGGHRGVVGRGGSSRGPSTSGPTSVVNGVVVPKFGPGAFEAMKVAKQAGASSGGAGAQQNGSGEEQK